MELEAKVNYGNGWAGYRIRREAPGIYFARLVFYDGEKNKPLPDGITLVRGIRQWTGSTDDEALLHELGKIIEEHLLDTESQGSGQRQKA